jgi:hypothetical protein
MQSVNHPIYTYDAKGRLTNYTPSGASNDVVSQHLLLDPRIPGPRSLVSGGLVAEIKKPVLNSPHLFVPPLSLTSPPVVRPKTLASTLGYPAFQNLAEEQDVYSITTAAPLLSPPGQKNNLTAT